MRTVIQLVLHRVSLSLLFCALGTGIAAVPGNAEERGRSFEVSLGGGINLNGINSTQFLFAPAVSAPLAGSRSLRLALEGDIEVIDYRSRSTLIAGLAPMVRATWPAKTVRPFIELGGGINYAARNNPAGKELNGPLLFSAMGGVGLEVVSGGRPLRVSYRLRHLSNGHLYKGNEGINTQYLMLSTSF